MCYSLALCATAAVVGCVRMQSNGSRTPCGEIYPTQEFPRFSKPQWQFLEQMLYGMQAVQDVKLSNIALALGENSALKKTEELTLVVVRGFGEKPLMLPTHMDVRASRASLWSVVHGWRRNARVRKLSTKICRANHGPLRRSLFAAATASGPNPAREPSSTTGRGVAGRRAMATGLWAAISGRRYSAPSSQHRGSLPVDDWRFAAPFPEQFGKIKLIRNADLSPNLGNRDPG